MTLFSLQVYHQLNLVPKHLDSEHAFCHKLLVLCFPKMFQLLLSTQRQDWGRKMYLVFNFEMKKGAYRWVHFIEGPKEEKGTFYLVLKSCTCT